jgi:hypothetical protein
MSAKNKNTYLDNKNNKKCTLLVVELFKDHTCNSELMLHLKLLWVISMKVEKLNYCDSCALP